MELKELYPTYQDYKTKRQAEFDALPIKFAFSDKQFEEVCEELGGKTADDFYRIPVLGGFCLKEDLPAVSDWLNKPDPLPELVKDYDWAKGAFLYEMGNHEYHINWQADWDVINCFTHVDYDEGEEKGYLNCTDWERQTKQAYIDARSEFYRQCDENGWW